jgi:hypothetical protein
MKSLDQQAPEHTLIFDPLQDNRTNISLIDWATGRKNNLEVTIDDRAFKHRIQQES